MASPLVTAMLRGGVCILDEGNRMSEKSWASLAPLLDHRRSVESVVAGITINAHEDFRFVTTMNEDASTYEVPEYIHSRLMPQIVIDFPDEDEERAILESQVGAVDDEVLDYVLSFLQAAHLADLRYSVRDGINIARYAMKTLQPRRGVRRPRSRRHRSEPRPRQRRRGTLPVGDGLISDFGFRISDFPPTVSQFKTRTGGGTIRHSPASTENRKDRPQIRNSKSEIRNFDP